jgi:hypothetical protein
MVQFPRHRCSYLASAPYTSRHIFNRPTQTTMTAPDASGKLHDDSYGTSVIYPRQRLCNKTTLR